METFLKTIHHQLIIFTKLTIFTTFKRFTTNVNLHPKMVEKPLGRWCFCGDNITNKSTKDVLQWKEIQKQKRLQMIENKQDPFELYQKKSINNGCEKEREEYMIPFVFDS